MGQAFSIRCFQLVADVAVFHRQIQQQLHRGLLNYQFATVYSAYMLQFFISSERVIKYKSQGL
jgi:hypothetical protein